MKIRECVLLIILIIVLVFGITLALCISLVLNPVGGSFSEGKLVAARGVNLIELNKKCNCGIMGLDYKFNVFNREAMSSNSSDNHSDENPSGDNSEAKFRSLVGPDTVYDEFQHMRSLGFSENEIKARLGSISLGPEDIKPDAKPTRPHNVTTTTATTTTQPISPRNRDFVIDDELIESIWKAINAKRMNMTKVAEVVNKRSFPMEAPHCFVPTLKEEKPSEDNNYKRWKFHPYLISISYPKYLDDQDDVRFICSGVIIDKEHAVTGKNCVMNKLKPFLKIRSNSPYWSKDGLLHQVLEIFYTTTLALLKVNPYFKLDAVLTWNKTENESVAKNITTSAGWITESRKKFSKYSVVRWGQDCEDCKTVVADNGTKCKNILGDPLINGAGILIGVRSCENSYLKIGEIASVLDRFRINY